jgi:CHASE1-domain containing sensor protein
VESPDCLPTAGDYAREDARAALLTAQGNAAKKLELEQEIVLLKGQVGFLAWFVGELLTGEVWASESDLKLLEQIKQQAKE